MMKKGYALLIAFILVFSLSHTAFAYEPAGDYYNQHVTGYRDSLYDSNKDGDWKDPAASGVEYEVGYCAVHPRTWGTSNWDKPIFPWGAIITLHTDQDPIPTPIDELSSFMVQDTGELNNEHHYTFHWFDVYCGRYTDYDMSDAQLVTWINTNIGTTRRAYTVDY